MNLTLNSLLTRFYGHFKAHHAGLGHIFNSLHSSTFCMSLGRSTTVFLTVSVWLSDWRTFSTRFAVELKNTYVHFTKWSTLEEEIPVAADSNCTNHGTWAHSRPTNHMYIHWDIVIFPPYVSSPVYCFLMNYHRSRVCVPKQLLVDDTVSY